ncbi:hypothetical protein KKG41_06410 [Patescibacteria group bacterium]|nr:hypothetical protein [Patescibacteria group bacterium]MBU1890217.1 hypothetical protein [Patescibacteria group bacterium]
MKRVIIIIIIVVAIAASANIYLSGQKTLKKSLDNGFQYLRSSYNDFSYDDDYLRYRYPGEELECPIANCDLTYRLLDAYFIVAMLNDAGVTEKQLGAQLGDSIEVLDAIKPIWQQGGIYNTQKSTGIEDYALDTYCIIGHHHADKKMADVVDHFRSGTDWLSEDYTLNDVWRNIADETWCTRLLILTEGDNQITQSLVKNLINETNTSLIGTGLSDQQTILYHMVHLLKEAQSLGLTVENLDSSLSLFTELLLTVTLEEELYNNPLIIANTLEALVTVNYPDQEKIHDLANRLILLQEKDGLWLPEASATQGQVFTTLRAVLALVKYQALLIK